MLCSSCKKNQATNIYERITDGKKQTEDYCADCYRRLFHSTENTRQNAENLVCNVCGYTAKEYFASGLVGCEHCYEALKDALSPSIKRMQGKEEHVGKTPNPVKGISPLEERRKALRLEVEMRLKNKDYKRASECLAELKELNGSMQREEQ